MASLPSHTEHDASLAFLLGRINYERTLTVPYRSRGFKLERMRRLLAKLDNPHQQLPAIHIAGTKGKGSTAAMIAAVLTAAGYRTGLYTSPHLDRIEERLVIDGQPCSDAELVDLVATVRPAVEQLDREAARGGREQGPTYFEVTTALAMLYFARRRVDLAVLEVGLGGRLDSTNVCHPLVSIITSISFDHMRQLGNTLAAIASEKAGIIKAGVPVVSGVRMEEPRRVIEDVAQECRAPLYQLGVDFDYVYRPSVGFPCGGESAADVSQANSVTQPVGGWLDYSAGNVPGGVHRNRLPLGLLGEHQAANASLALAALDIVGQRGYDVPAEAIAAGLAQVRCPARVEVVAHRPTVVIDAAHNPASIVALTGVLDTCFATTASNGRPPQRILVFAGTQEKDIAAMIRPLLPHFDQVIFTRYLNNPRSVEPGELMRLAEQLRSEGNGNGQPWPRELHECDNPSEAYQRVRLLATPEHLVCVTGSFFIAAEMRAQFTGSGVLATPK